jgi:Outer membrane protein beta-barrel domain
MYLLKGVLILICLLGGTTMLRGQATPTASKTADLKIGGGYTYANADYDGKFHGGAAFFNLDLSAHLGVEGTFHFIQDGTSAGLYEKTYEVGGRYFRNYRKWAPYGKLMYGRGVFNFPAYVPGGPHPNLAYNLMAIGAGADYKALPYLYVRGDFEYQYWFGFPPSGLTPALLTVGVVYHFR